MLLVCCGAVEILSLDVHFIELTGRNFENGKYKITYIGLQNARKDTMES